MSLLCIRYPGEIDIYCLRDIWVCKKYVYSQILKYSTVLYYMYIHTCIFVTKIQYVVSILRWDYDFMGMLVTKFNDNSIELR